MRAATLWKVPSHGMLSIAPPEIWAIRSFISRAALLVKVTARIWLGQARRVAMMWASRAVKAAVFPMSGWLPDSYPTAPAPVTAVFAGLLTKVGVYAMIRTQTLLFPGGLFQDLLLWAALLTMVVAQPAATAALT